MFNPELYSEYFRWLFPAQELDHKGVQKRRLMWDFPETARRFRLIPDDTEPAVVRYEPDKAKVSRLLAQARDGSEEPRRLLRMLQPYVVNIRRRELPPLQRRGILLPVREGLWEWRGAYDPVRGVGVPQAGLDPEPLVF